MKLVLQELSELKGETQKINTHLKGIEDTIAEIKTEQTAMKNDIAEIRAEQAVMKKDIAEIKAEQTAMKNDIAEIRAEQAVMKKDIAEIKAEQAVMKQDIHMLQEEQKNIRILIENNVIKQICIIAEAHMDIKRNFDILREMYDRYESIAINVQVLNKDVGDLKRMHAMA